VAGGAAGLVKSGAIGGGGEADNRREQGGEDWATLHNLGATLAHN